MAVAREVVTVRAGGVGECGDGRDGELRCGRMVGARYGARVVLGV